MKKQILIALIVILWGLNGCDDDVPEELKAFAVDLIEHPEKVMNLKEHYPQFYDEDFINKEVMNSPRSIKRTTKDLETYFNRDASDLSITKIGLSHLTYRDWKKRGYFLDEDKGFSFKFHRNNKSLRIVYFVINGNYKLFYIRTGYHDPYL